jgi:hypothetical protein
MIKKGLFSLCTIFISLSAMAQPRQNNSTDLPYYQIPDYPDGFTAANVAARMVDGLGFRYYWATEGLREEDLAFRPNDDARTSNETLDHILGLTKLMLNAVKKTPNINQTVNPVLNFEEKRRITLENIKLTSEILKASKPGEMEEFNIIFVNGDKIRQFPFWNQLNGPIADAIWHVGQVVSFRRSSGNPFNGKADVFSGKLRD